MQGTDTITIEVDAETARLYRAADTDRRQRVRSFVTAALLRENLTLSQLLDVANAQAEASGYGGVEAEELERWLSANT